MIWSQDDFLMDVLFHCFYESNVSAGTAGSVLRWLLNVKMCVTWCSNVFWALLMGETDALSVIPTHPYCLWEPSQETCLISVCGTRKHLAHSGTRCFKWMQLFDCNVDWGSNYFILGLFSYTGIYWNDLCNFSKRVYPKNLKTSPGKSGLNEPIMIEYVSGLLWCAAFHSVSQFHAPHRHHCSSSVNQQKRSTGGDTGRNGLCILI